MMLALPQNKYTATPRVNLPDRLWPNRGLIAAPVWLSTDLRDGNQALFEPMNVAQKMQLFKLLCAIGFKEIEVAFPSASQTEFDFVRELIEGGHIPDDVTISVLTQARSSLIARTMASLRGARRAIVHVYHATSPLFRERVFALNCEQVKAMAVDAVTQIHALTIQQPETEWVLEYSPETFNATELDFALEICHAVAAAWGATPVNRVIFNLPATVECAMPNVYADQIEWMHRNLVCRDSVVLSIHPHNDRGTAVAAAELGMLAGADRVEGCLLGNGERTGNVDIVTLALNLYTQGIAPNLDFSDIHAVMREIEAITGLVVPPRHPYAGDLVFTAFSGSHQDAIKKGMAQQAPEGLWSVPYLPIDPADLGRSYDSVIRVNSQSGKGGIAWLLENHYGLSLPRRLQIEFAAQVQKYLDAHGKEIGAEALWMLFSQQYLQTEQPYRYVSHHLTGDGAVQGIRMTVQCHGVKQVLTGEGNGPIAAAVHALQGAAIHLQLYSFEEQSVGEGAQATACAYIEARLRHGRVNTYGAGMDANSVTAAIKALISAANRLSGN